MVSGHFGPLRAFLEGRLPLLRGVPGPWDDGRSAYLSLLEWRGWDPEPVLLVVWSPEGLVSLSCLSPPGGFPAAISERLERDLWAFQRNLNRGSRGRVVRRFRLMEPDRARLFAEAQLRAHKSATS